MSYALDLSVEVRERFVKMPVDLQEALLDMFDLIATEASGKDSDSERVASEAVVEIGRFRHYAFFTYARDSSTKTVIIDSLGYVARSISNP